MKYSGVTREMPKNFFNISPAILSVLVFGLLFRFGFLLRLLFYESFSSCFLPKALLNGGRCACVCVCVCMCLCLVCARADLSVPILGALIDESLL